MSRAIDKGTMLNLIIEAKRTDPETGSFAEWLAEYLVEHLETFTQPNEWVSVEDAVPDPGERVLATDGTFVGEAYRTSANTWYRHTGFPWRDCLQSIVTLWMPLPTADKDNHVPAKALTLEQLREMDEEPVYVVPKDKPAHCGGWCGVTVWKCDRYSYVSLLRDADSGWGFEEYGKTWIAYRRPPEGEEDT